MWKLNKDMYQRNGEPTILSKYTFVNGFAWRFQGLDEDISSKSGSLQDKFDVQHLLQVP